jgi:hypothetical protein
MGTISFLGRPTSRFTTPSFILRSSPNCASSATISHCTFASISSLLIEENILLKSICLAMIFQPQSTTQNTSKALNKMQALKEVTLGYGVHG